MKPSVHRWFGAAASTVMVAAVCWGFFLVGSPIARREERIDERRVSDLQNIASEICDMVCDPNKKGELKAELPATLADAAEQARYWRINTTDPESGAPYRYTVTSRTTFELCAEFARPRNEDFRVFWNHDAGKKCFSIDVLDPPR